MENKIHVLSTREIPVSLVTQAAQGNIILDTDRFISTERIDTIEVQQEIENALLLSATVIFTSMNAVEAVAVYLQDQQPDWKIYCIGHTTRTLAEQYFGEDSIAGFSQDASSLAWLIVEQQLSHEFIFFCGNIRRDELPEILRDHDLLLNEIVVYTTIPLPHKIKGNYHGILFFSPSAVESFFQMNTALPGIVFFSIGNSTAACIRKYCSNTIINANMPGKENLVEKMIEYFT